MLCQQLVGNRKTSQLLRTTQSSIKPRKPLGFPLPPVSKQAGHLLLVEVGTAGPQPSAALLRQVSLGKQGQTTQDGEGSQAHLLPSTAALGASLAPGEAEADVASFGVKQKTK